MEFYVIYRVEERTATEPRVFFDSIWTSKILLNARLVELTRGAYAHPWRWKIVRPLYGTVVDDS